ncbi:hypothetical protein GGP85_000054 [Salinibacter ruber]|uniref:hypothetical protein n=1 Tax=Salinibacter ruber TaxID=146919 RepID=UPI00216797B5|nr:hypothetical protein [Salinibacter ruber]MCS3628189.1 hypothetical protein [Salinibacter ruber]MCS3824634.1 hypothetical protein [Salinibacter ruber]MCS4145098.1 hypothetical protein [Salinibacter ruber]
MHRLRWIAIVPLLLLLAPPAVAQEPVPTTVVVRAVSNDAKLIQDPVGGARITIEHARSGEVLAEGRQTGDSGSTEKIMRQPHERGASIYDAPGAAQYETTLDLTEPTRVRVTAEGPLDYPQATQTASKTVLLVPGEHVTGDGITLTLHGFIVEVLKPSSTGPQPGAELSVRARVRMLCGCPTEPGGMWDANRYTIRAQLLRDGAVVAEAPLAFAGTTNEYAGTVSVPEAGATRLRVMAQDADRINFGAVTRPLSQK